MHRIVIAEVAGENCISMQAGQILFNMIEPILSTGETAELDFEGVNVCASPFLNAGVGRLLQVMSRSDLEARIEFVNVKTAIMDVIERVLSNSETYYADPTSRIAFNHIVADEEDE